MPLVVDVVDALHSGGVEDLDSTGIVVVGDVVVDVVDVVDVRDVGVVEAGAERAGLFLLSLLLFRLLAAAVYRAQFSGWV